MIASTSRAALASLLLGALLPLGFEPFGWFWIVPLLLAALFVLLLEASFAKSLVCGFCFGCGAFAVGASWVYVSLTRFGGLPPPAAALCVLAFVALLSCFPMLATALQYPFRRLAPGLRLGVAMPVCWMAAEILRNHLFTGFPWLEIGYSQTGFWLGHAAPLVGVHGVGLLLATCSGLVAALALGRRKWTGIALIATALAPWSLAKIDWTEPSGEPVTAALVQAVVPLDVKWNRERSATVAARYFELSASQRDLDLIVWPEAALPHFLDQVSDSFYDGVVALEAPLLAGFIERWPAGEGFRYYNSAVLFDDRSAVYRKRHLVPFGEYSPLEFLFTPLMRAFEVPRPILSPWTAPQQPMRIGAHRVGVGICYEDAFPHHLRRIARGADYLVNISEDAWFGDSLGPRQRLQMARMRSHEAGRPMFRVSNTGSSALIDHRGALVARSPDFETFVLRGELQPRAGVTPYMRFGDWPLLATMILMLAAAWATRKRGLPR